MKIKMGVIGRNAGGEPDVLVIEVDCSDADYANGDHYDVAMSQAGANGFVPVMAFDENDPAWARLNAPKPTMISSLGVAGIARAAFGNPIPTEAYEFAEKLQTAMIENGTAQVGVEASYRRVMDKLIVTYASDESIEGADFIADVADLCIGELARADDGLVVGVAFCAEGFINSHGGVVDEFTAIFDLDAAQSIAKSGDTVVWIPASFLSGGPFPGHSDLLACAENAIALHRHEFTISEEDASEVMREQLGAGAFSEFPEAMNPILSRIMMGAFERRNQAIRERGGE